MKWNRKRRKAHQKLMRYLRRPADERLQELMAYARSQMMTTPSDAALAQAINEASQFLADATNAWNDAALYTMGPGGMYRITASVPSTGTLTV
jgi:hypothetical protein